MVSDLISTQTQEHFQCEQQERTCLYPAGSGRIGREMAGNGRSNLTIFAQEFWVAGFMFSIYKYSKFEGRTCKADQVYSWATEGYDAPHPAVRQYQTPNGLTLCVEVQAAHGALGQLSTAAHSGHRPCREYRVPRVSVVSCKFRRRGGPSSGSSKRIDGEITITEIAGSPIKTTHGWLSDKTCTLPLCHGHGHGRTRTRIQGPGGRGRITPGSTIHVTNPGSALMLIDLTEEHNQEGACSMRGGLQAGPFFTQLIRAD